jgi:hypothetical protein
MSKKIIKSSKIDNCCEMTFCALNAWYKSEFEKLGWMILADNRGFTDKIESYKMSLNRLLKSLNMKIKDVKDFDKKHDLELMHHNVEILMKHIEKDFK